MSFGELLAPIMDRAIRDPKLRMILGEGSSQGVELIALDDATIRRGNGEEIATQISSRLLLPPIASPFGCDPIYLGHPSKGISGPDPGDFHRVIHQTRTGAISICVRLMYHLLDALLVRRREVNIA